MSEITSEKMIEKAEERGDRISQLIAEIRDKLDEIESCLKVMSFHYKEAVALAANPHIVKQLLQQKKIKKK